MAKIAIAGGNSQVANEVLDVLVATGKHEITLLSRGEAPNKPAIEEGVIEEGKGGRVNWIKVSYTDKQSLTRTLRERKIDTVLSFIDTRHDVGGLSQKGLIDAAVAAGVRRFAPSEWSVSASLDFMADGKAAIREYLAEVNREKKVIEYCIFQCGIFLNYLAAPYPAAKHIRQLNTWFDFQNCRAIVLEEDEEGADETRLSFTTAQDLAGVVARAVDYEGEWPVTGGMRGSTVSPREIIALGEKIRGKKFQITTLKKADLLLFQAKLNLLSQAAQAGNEAGKEKEKEEGEKEDQLNLPWYPLLNHPSIPPHMVASFSKLYLVGALLLGASGGYVVSEEWNLILGGDEDGCDRYEFMGIEEFLLGVWEGKP